MSLNWRQNVRGAVPEVVARVLDRIQGGLSDLQAAVEELQRRQTSSSGGSVNLPAIRQSLQAGGATPLNVEGLLGKLGQAQIAGAPSVSNLPLASDPVSKEGALVSLSGAPDTIYRFDQSVDPGTWRQVVTSGMVSVQKAGVAVGTRQTLNLIEGSNVTLTVADNGGASRVDVTVAAVTAAPVAAQYVTLAAHAGLSDERVLTGTANQVILTDSGAGAVLTLSTPQSIGTGSAVQFGSLQVAGAKFLGYTTTAADPTVTEYPADKNFGLHKNSVSGDLFLAFNDGGATIKKVVLT